MLFGLVLLLCGLLPLEAGLRPSGFHPTPKEGLPPPKEIKGCMVDESCNGDFVPPGDSISQKECISYTEQIKNPEGGEVARMDEVLVFVSFSMPDGSLKALFDAAAQHKAVLVMRGLYENSFVKTAEKLQHMGVVADINPELFDTYGIEHVPVFVRLQHGKEVARLSGNVSLDFAMSKLGDVS